MSSTCNNKFTIQYCNSGSGQGEIAEIATKTPLKQFKRISVQQTNE